MPTAPIPNSGRPSATTLCRSASRGNPVLCVSRLARTSPEAATISRIRHAAVRSVHRRGRDEALGVPMVGIDEESHEGHRVIGLVLDVGQKDHPRPGSGDGRGWFRVAPGNDHEDPNKEGATISTLRRGRRQCDTACERACAVREAGAIISSSAAEVSSLGRSRLSAYRFSARRRGDGRRRMPRAPWWAVPAE